MSPRPLQRSFEREIGRPISVQLERLRLERAKRLLVESQAPGKEIARQSGFGSHHNLCRAMKRREGISPIQYRGQRLAKILQRRRDLVGRVRRGG